MQTPVLVPRGRGWGANASAQDAGETALKSLWLLRLVEEAGFRSRVARGAGRLHAQKHAVEVTVEADLHDLHEVARCGALPPKSALAGMEPGAPGLAGL